MHTKKTREISKDFFLLSFDIQSDWGNSDVVSMAARFTNDNGLLRLNVLSERRNKAYSRRGVSFE